MAVSGAERRDSKRCEAEAVVDMEVPRIAREARAEGAVTNRAALACDNPARPSRRLQSSPVLHRTSHFHAVLYNAAPPLPLPPQHRIPSSPDYQEALDTPGISPAVAANLKRCYVHTNPSAPSTQARRERQHTRHSPNSENTPPPLPVSVHRFFTAVGLVCTLYQHRRT